MSSMACLIWFNPEVEMRKWMPAALIGIAYAVSLALSGQLPSTVIADLSPLLPFEIDEQPDRMPRLVAVLGLPTVALALWLLLHEAPIGALGRAAGRLFFPKIQHPRVFVEAEYEKFAPTYRVIVIWVVALVLSMHAALLAVALAWPIAPGLIVGLTFGLGLIAVGNVLPRLRQNPVAGIRTGATMANAQLWARTHRAYGGLWVAGGIIVTTIAFVAPRFALLTALLVLMLTSVGALALPRTLVISTLALVSHLVRLP
jgi:hypothetical protein